MNPKPMKPGEIIRMLKKDGWHEVPARGGHRQFKHPMKPNKITVPFHNKELKPLTLKTILKAAGLLDQEKQS